MTGIELIKWIQENNAEDLLVLVEYRDSGGSYHEAGEAEPCSVRCSRNSVADDTYHFSIQLDDKPANAILL